jgi:hypothetical protein
MGLLDLYLFDCFQNEEFNMHLKNPKFVKLRNSQLGEKNE